jgi:hypothetical protein
MSMDEMLLNELYGSEEVQQEEQIKQAQVELVEAVAAEAGVNLSELDDEELAKFAHYVLSDEDELVDNSDLDKIAALEQADSMGRQMAHSYVHEINSIRQGDPVNRFTQEKIASAMHDIADAWEQEKIALSREEIAAMIANPGGPAKGDQVRGGNLGRQLAEMEQRAGTASDAGKRTAGIGGFDTEAAGRSANKSTKGTDKGREAVSNYYDKQYSNNTKLTRPEVIEAEAAKKARGGVLGHLGRHKGKYLAGAGAAAALGGGLYYMKKKREQEKKTAALLDNGYEALALIDLYEPEEFAKEAEFRAAEILLANGVDPETFEDVYPEHVKIASFPDVHDAADRYEAQLVAEYNEMLDTAAMHIIDELID